MLQLSATKAGNSGKAPIEVTKLMGLITASSIQHNCSAMRATAEAMAMRLLFNEGAVKGATQRSGLVISCQPHAIQQFSVCVIVPLHETQRLNGMAFVAPHGTRPVAHSEWFRPCH